MKVLFLDIDGVVNCRDTKQRYRRVFIGIDPHMASLVGKIVLDTDCTVVLSSSWRNFHDDGIEEISRQVTPIHHVTPRLPEGIRGEEIQAWLDDHPEVTRYAILDDDVRMLESQRPHFFQTSLDTGITKEIAEAVTNHLNQL